MRYSDNDPTAQYWDHSQPRRLARPSAPRFVEPVDAPDVSIKSPWRDYWASLRKRWIAIALLGLVFAIAAAFYARSMQPVFRSTATVLIEAAKTKILSIEEVYSAVSQDREYYQTQVEILRSRDVALRAVIASKLWNVPQFDPRRPHDSLWTRIRRIGSEPAPQTVWTPQMLAEATVGNFLGSVSVEPVRLSQLVKVSFEANDPELAANLANATAQSYIEADRDARLKLNQEVTNLLQDRLAALRDKLLQSEEALQAFREKEGLVNLSGSQGVAGQQLSDVAQRLLAAKVRRTELESAYQQIGKVTDGDYSGLPGVVGQSSISDAKNRVSLAQAKVEELSHTLGSQHSRMIEAQGELAAAQQFLRSQTQSVLSSLRREYLAAQETERALSTAMGAARGSVQEVNRQGFQLGVLEREVQANRQLYELFLSRVKETSVSSNLQSAVARVVDPASRAGAPLRPNKPQITLLALALGLLIGAVIAVLLDKLDKTVKGSAEAEQRLNQPVLASIPGITVSDGQPLTRLYLDRPSSDHSDAIRTARTAVLLSSFEASQKVVLVTSTLRGEGKTTFCSNLAFAHAYSKRTLLIDANLRFPQIGVRLGLPENAKGLSNLIAGGSAIADCVHPIEGSSLMVMPAGDFPSNPEELLLSTRFQHALRSLVSRVEIVLIDSPPIELFSDALMIAPHVSNVIYVVQAKRTPMVLARRSIEKLQRAGASILGLVLTHFSGDGGRQFANAEYRTVEIDSVMDSNFFEPGREEITPPQRESALDMR